MAKSIDVVVGADKRRLPLETWINSAADVDGRRRRRPAMRSGADLFRDENGALDPKIPKDKVVSVEIEPIRKGRLAVDGYQARGQFYSQAERPKAEAVAGWRLIGRFRPVQPLKVDALAFSPDGSWLVASLQTFKVVGLDLKSGAEKLFPESMTARARFFAFTDGRPSARQGRDRRQAGEDPGLDGRQGLRPAARFDRERARPATIRIASPTGDRVAIRRLRSLRGAGVRRRRTPFRLARPPADVGFAYRVGCFSPDGKRFAIGVEHPEKGGKVYVWDLIPGVGDKLDSALPPRDVFVDRQTGIHFLSFSADGDVVAASGKQATGVWVWRLDSGKESAIRLEGGIANVHAIDAQPGRQAGRDLGDAVLVRHSDSAADPARHERWPTLAVLSGLRAPIHAVTFSRDGRRFAAGDAEGLVQVWEQNPKPRESRRFRSPYPWASTSIRSTPGCRSTKSGPNASDGVRNPGSTAPARTCSTTASAHVTVHA